MTSDLSMHLVRAHKVITKLIRRTGVLLRLLLGILSFALFTLDYDMFALTSDSSLE